MSRVAEKITTSARGVPLTDSGWARWGRRNVIVRQLTAVEGLGGCTLIATDKTGTLTCNERTIREVRLGNGDLFSVTGQGFAPVGEVTHGGNAVAPGSSPELMELVSVADRSRCEAVALDMAARGLRVLSSALFLVYHLSS